MKYVSKLEKMKQVMKKRSWMKLVMQEKKRESWYLFMSNMSMHTLVFSFVVVKNIEFELVASHYSRLQADPLQADM